MICWNLYVVLKKLNEQSSYTVALVLVRWFTLLHRKHWQRISFLRFSSSGAFSQLLWNIVTKLFYEISPKFVDVQIFCWKVLFICSKAFEKMCILVYVVVIQELELQYRIALIYTYSNPIYKRINIPLFAVTLWSMMFVIPLSTNLPNAYRELPSASEFSLYSPS